MMMKNKIRNEVLSIDMTQTQMKALQVDKMNKI